MCQAQNRALVTLERGLAYYIRHVRDVNAVFFADGHPFYECACDL